MASISQLANSRAQVQRQDGLESLVSCPVSLPWRSSKPEPPEASGNGATSGSPAKGWGGIVCLSRCQPWQMTPEYQMLLLTQDAKTHGNQMPPRAEGGGNSPPHQWSVPKHN